MFHIARCLVTALLLPYTYNAEISTASTGGVLFYNTENLFDTFDTPGKKDEDFTPSGAYRYSPYKYRKRIASVAQALRIASAHCLQDGAQAVWAIALCEVENRAVLEDLARHPALQIPGHRWSIHHVESLDARGIDCGLLINTAAVEVHQQLHYRYAHDGLKTRDALSALITPNHSEDSLWVTTVHLPSKRGGNDYSVPKRMHAINRLCQDFFTGSTPHLLLGDFNTSVKSTEIAHLLKHSNFTPLPSAVTHVRYGRGSYKYQGKWSTIDLAFGAGLTGEMYICNPKALVTQDTKWNGWKPHRAWLGPRWNGGYSDHLPIYVILNNLEN